MLDLAASSLRVVRLATRHPQVRDMALGLCCALTYLAAISLGNEHGRHPARELYLWDVVAAVATVALVGVRRRWPRVVLTLAVAAAVASMAVGESRAMAVPAAVIAAYTVATVSSRRVAWTAGASAALTLYAASLLWPGRVWPDSAWWERGNLGLVAAVGMAVAVGDAIRTQRAYVAAVEERARRAEESREEEAHRRVIEERLRIARELHDVVAHHLALISVQAGVAGHLMQRRPEQSAAALGLVRQAANTAVEELGTVLAVLREDSDPERSTEPTPGVADVPALVDTVAAAGLRVRLRQQGAARPLPAGADLAAYRIIQECLTNAHKHGTGPDAQLCLAYTEAGVTIEITNPARVPVEDQERPTGTGHGLIGMRERVAAVGGTLRAGPTGDDAFVVHAFVPAAERAGEPR